MAQTKTAYEIRYYPDQYAMECSKQAGRKLFSRARAQRVVRFLKRRTKVNAFIAPVSVDKSAKLAA